MIQKIVECVPNFSEGRRPNVIQVIERSIADTSGVFVLDRHSDPDHNRTVITFAGPPASVLEAAYRAIETAAQKIDLNKHQGEHPRLGATDVVPFVPLSGSTMDECVTLARELGKRVGDDLGIPVYLYERAAIRPDRVNLEDVRRGEFEALKDSLGKDPARDPDFGPKQLGPAGATIIGARPALIAYNVYLSTNDVSVAKKIARAVRHSSGGLRYVKAMGMLVEGQAQVSMNLTDFTRTPVARVQEMIRIEAQRFGTTIDRAELVGLIPQAALADASQWYLQLESFSPEQILETRLFSTITGSAEGQDTFLKALAAETPTPGGGAAAAYAGAMAAALVAMVARLTVGKKKYSHVQDRMTEIVHSADQLRASLQSASLRDAEAFEAVMEAYRLPKDAESDRAQREDEIQRATHKATQIPLEVAQQAVEVLKMAAETAESGNVNAASDAGTAAVIAFACLQGAAMNVRINAASMADRKRTDRWLKDLEKLEKQAQTLAGRSRNAIRERVGI